MAEEKTIREFLDELASKASTPGGGSAAAIIGAMGAALVSMVCNLTIGKKNYTEVEEEFRGVLHKAEALRERLTGMIEADIDVFAKVMAAYGMPRDTEDEKAARTQAIQAALKEATVVPLACARACADVINLSKTAAEKGNLNVISDAGVAVVAAYAALRSAALNVYINVGGIKDEAFANEKRAELQRILAGTDRMTEEVYALVKSKL
ncbi:MAG: cyclodeaminase/cyclohydrolase family protein [Gammaproteobacteria bacterium]|nr:cyclodeaminase/cyclohydrolase family protein [Gammaproteobacteria bacterium]MCI0591726.1 cyclodeaminase/cyclohydrolase family protein [Gammaproteobacteria bacterium]